MTTLKLKIYGKVQGVFFRANTKEKADKIGGLKGYVKNLSDGTVEVLVSGEKSKLNEFFEWLKEGPVHAQVDQIEMNWTNEKVKNKKFEIIR